MTTSPGAPAHLLHQCHPVKAYDIRGRAPEEVSPTLARTVGEAFAQLTNAQTIIVGHDMRPTSPDLASAFIDGARSRGTNVLDMGLTATDCLYYAAGVHDLPAAMITASHNPASDNGIKLCRRAVTPIARDTGLEDIHAYLHTGHLPGSSPRPRPGPPGTVTAIDPRPQYTRHLRSLVDLSTIRHLKIVADAGNGMAALTLPDLLAHSPVAVERLYFDLDGTFPNHDANPMDPANLRDLQQAVVTSGADLGLAFDGDADRCFIVDEQGHAVSPDAVLALLAIRHLISNPGASVVHDLLVSTATREIIHEHGGQPMRSRVGHSFIKTVMADTHAILGGETSGHYYFRDLWHADSGPLAALHALAALGSQPLPASQIFTRYTRYTSSGEINIPAGDAATAMEAVAAHYNDIDHLDGMTVTFGPNHWFNLRPSNIEPILRLTVEAPTQPAMATLRDAVLRLLSESIM